MAKIVYNACYGGFGLSERAMLRYFELRGEPVAAEYKSEAFRRMGVYTLRRASDGAVVGRPDFLRHDPALVQVVEELGEAAGGEYANLKIAEVPSGTGYRIDEYDGMESVMTADDYVWTIAP